MAHASPHGAADGLSFFSHLNFPRAKRLVPELQERMRLQIAGRSRHFGQICPRGRILNCLSPSLGWEHRKGTRSAWQRGQALDDSHLHPRPVKRNKEHDIVLSLMHTIWQRDTQLPSAGVILLGMSSHLRPLRQTIKEAVTAGPEGTADEQFYPTMQSVFRGGGGQKKEKL